jgi:3,4-dihydroxy 2-butanone 4-phosphate synthase/GTP cyclohydrolase II
MSLSTIEEAVKDLRDGKMVILVDDEDRENEGDLIIASEKVTPESINFMATHGKGLICVPVLTNRLNELNIPMMVNENTSRHTTAFTVSIDSNVGTTTGISAYDRASTILAMIDPATSPYDLDRPGHIFPLRYQEGGVLVRAGQTEGSIDLTKLAELYPSAVLCEIMGADGTMSRMADLEKFSEEHGIKIVSVAQIITHRMLNEKLIERVADAKLPTSFGQFTAVAFKSQVDSDEHIALVMGDVDTSDSVLVRVHSECLTGDVFGSIRCDCGPQISLAMDMIAKEGRGVFLYMRQEGRGIGLHNKIKAYSLQDQGMDTVEANTSLGFSPDLRHYGIGAQILVDLGVKNMRILTNNPKKIVGLDAYGLNVSERIPIIIPTTPANERYMKTKYSKLGHLLDFKE